MNLGERIKKKRALKNISLRDLATRIDLTASFLSQIEQGKAFPSLDNLKKIAKNLDTSVVYLIEDEMSKTSLIKKYEKTLANTLDLNTKISVLTEFNFLKSLQPFLYEIAPSGQSFRENLNFKGEDFIYIIEGNLEFYINGKKYELSEGDSFYFKECKKYKFLNNSKEIVKLLWVKK